MRNPLVGLHHVTAIASDPQRNLDFYTEVVGLRFIKRTVNFDDPDSYHFYFGDDIGTPGTILTFFPWPNAQAGEKGSGETISIAFSIPHNSLPFWRERLEKKGIAYVESTIFGDLHMSFSDPDGMRVELVEQTEVHPVHAPRYADVPEPYAIQGFFGVTLLESSLMRTQALLGIMGYRKLAEEGDRARYAPQSDARGRVLDIVLDHNAPPGQMGAGTVHHIAFRASDDHAQLDWRQELSRTVRVTPVLDRTYFHSIYFREPGGVLFEIATENPGFLIDEPVETLGELLKVPEWMDSRKDEIEARVTPITLHKHVPAEVQS